MSRSEKRARGPFGLGPGLRRGVGFGARLAFACALSGERPPAIQTRRPAATSLRTSSKFQVVPLPPPEGCSTSKSIDR